MEMTSILIFKVVIYGYLICGSVKDHQWKLKTKKKKKKPVEISAGFTVLPLALGESCYFRWPGFLEHTLVGVFNG